MDSLSLNLDSLATSFLLFIFTTLLAGVVKLSLKKYLHKSQLLRQIPCPEGNLIFGHLHLLMAEQNRLPSKSITEAYFNLINTLGIIYQSASIDSLPSDNQIKFKPGSIKKSGLFRINFTALKAVVHVVSADVAEIILSNSTILEKPFQYKLLNNWLGSGLLTSSGSEWKEDRKLLSKAFHSQILKSFHPLINREAMTLCQQLLLHSRSKETLSTEDAVKTKDHLNNSCLSLKLNDFAASKTCHTFNDSHGHWLLQLLITFSLDIILQTVIGSSMTASDQMQKKREYIQALQEYSILYIKRVSSPWQWNDFIYHNFSSSGAKAKKVIHIMKSYTNCIIEGRMHQIIYSSHFNSKSSDINSEDIESEEASTSTTHQEGHAGTRQPWTNERKTSVSPRKSLLDILLKSHLEDGKITLEQVSNQVDTFVFAGHDTTALALFYTLLLLGHHPREQRRLRKEIDLLFDQRAKSKSGHSTSPMDDEDEIILDEEDFKNAPYLDAVIKESLRLFPPVPMIGREISKDINVGGYTLPAGTSVTLDIFRIQRDPNVFAPDAETFNPERFLYQSLKGNRKLSYFISEFDNRHRMSRFETEFNSGQLTLPVIFERSNSGPPGSSSAACGTNSPGNLTSQLKPNYNFIPFSSGLRSCIGSKFALGELKIALSHILRRMEVKCCTPLNELSLAEEIVLKPHNLDINITFKSRTDAKEAF